MKKRFNKKGSHVGVVISFMIFVIFLLFVQFIVAPAVNTNKDKKTLLESVERNIINKSSSVMKTATVSVSSSVTSNCVSISSFISGFKFGLGIKVTSEEGNPISSSLASDLNTLQISRNSNSENLLKIHGSEIFDTLSSGTISCSAITEGSSYTLGVSNNREYIFEEKIENLIGEYSNYSKLKTDLNIPKDTELGIAFIYENGSLISTTERNVTTSVYISEKQIEYVDSNGKILSGKLRVKIW